MCPQDRSRSSAHRTGRTCCESNQRPCSRPNAGSVCCQRGCDRSTRRSQDSTPRDPWTPTRHRRTRPAHCGFRRRRPTADSARQAPAEPGPRALSMCLSPMRAQCPRPDGRIRGADCCPDWAASRRPTGEERPELVGGQLRDPEFHHRGHRGRKERVSDPGPNPSFLPIRLCDLCALCGEIRCGSR